MRVLVTGATGFVGRAIISELSERGIDIVAVGGLGSASSDLPRISNFFSIDVSDEGSFGDVERAGKIDAVVHAAGLAHRFGRVDDDEYERINVGGVRNIASLAVRLEAKHFLLISSVLVYGRQRLTDDYVITEDQVCEPGDAYARSKRDGELEAIHVCEENRIGLTILRPAPIIGEGSRGNFARLIRAIDKRRFIWIGDGTNSKSLVYVVDVARVAANVLQKKKEGAEIFNVAGKPITMGELVNTISMSLGKPVLPVRISPMIVRKGLRLIGGIGPKAKVSRILGTLETWLSQDVYSVDKLREAYGVEAKTEITEAIRREVLWYKSNK